MTSDWRLTGRRAITGLPGNRSGSGSQFDLSCSTGKGYPAAAQRPFRSLGLACLACARRHVAQTAHVLVVQVVRMDHEMAAAVAAHGRFEHAAFEETVQGPRTGEAQYF